MVSSLRVFFLLLGSSCAVAWGKEHAADSFCQDFDEVNLGKWQEAARSENNNAFLTVAADWPPKGQTPLMTLQTAVEGAKQQAKDCTAA